MKKIFAFVLSLVMLLSVFSVSSSAIDWDWLENDRSFKNYKDLLFDIYYSTFKYCDLCEYSYSNVACTSHYFAIADINDDGIDELVVQFYCEVMASQYMAVWTYDRTIGRVKLFSTFDELTSFYKTGYIKTDWSHNQGGSWPLWPYNLYRINSSGDDVSDVGWAESYDIGESYYVPEYDGLIDADNDGILYFFHYTDEDKPIPLTYTEYKQIEETYIPDNALIYFDYKNVSDYEINNLEANYGSDLSSDGTMTGDLNADNKITAADARFALRFAAKIDIPKDKQKSLADVDGNGKITAADARKILRVAAKIDSGFGTATIPDFIYNKESYNGVYVDDAENVLEYFENSVYYSSESEYSGDYVFYTDENITDFCFLDIITDWNTFPDWENSVVIVNHSFGDLKKDNPIVIQMTFHEFVPIHGISFIDANGIYHRYAIHQSGEDGSVYLAEF